VIWELRHEHKIGLLIDFAEIPRSTYYYYEKQFKEQKSDKYADVNAEIRRIYDESKGRYGYLRITKELKKKYVINHKTVQRLMRKMGIFCRVRMHKYKEPLIKSRLRLGTHLACIFSAILHKFSLKYAGIPASNLYDLTKNLTAQSAHRI